jgi:hypothetical protein
MKNTSSSLTGCGCLLALVGIFGLFLGAGESQRAILIIFDISADILGTRSNASTVFISIGIGMIVIALVIELLKKSEEDPSSPE